MARRLIGGKDPSIFEQPPQLPYDGYKGFVDPPLRWWIWRSTDIASCFYSIERQIRVWENWGLLGWDVINV